MSTPRKTAAKPGGATGKQPAARKAAPSQGDAARPAGGAAGKGAAAKGAGKGTARKGAPLPPGPELVVGTVPPLARVGGGVAVVAAVLLLIAPAFPLARLGDTDLGGPGNLWAFVPALPLVALVAAAGALAATGRLPRLGLAVLFPAGTLAAGLLLQTVALLRTGSHSTLDLPLGIGTSARYEAGPGLVAHAVGYGLLVLAAVLAAAAWPRTIMEDGGDLDPRRPRLAAWGLAIGVLTALVLGMAPYSSQIAPGAPTLPERHGLDLLGGLVLTLGAAAWAVLAATLRPRLAVVGGYAGLAAALLTLGLANALLVARSDALGASAGGVGTLLAAVAVGALALVSARIGRLAAAKTS
ncbi:MAG TPA: hypothetical protein VLM05_00055 [Mycobacteriales bacterium]|nr:hypothetical protein [Mycobacteriales bacterium]